MQSYMHMYAYDPSYTYRTCRTFAPVRSGEFSWVYSVHMVHVSDFPRWRFGPRGQGLRLTNLRRMTLRSPFKLRNFVCRMRTTCLSYRRNFGCDVSCQQLSVFDFGHGKRSIEILIIGGCNLSNNSEDRFDPHCK